MLLFVCLLSLTGNINSPIAVMATPGIPEIRRASFHTRKEAK